MTATFTPHQRDILRQRVERAILWHQMTDGERDRARRLANVVLNELELSHLSAAAQRRAIDKVLVNLEERSA
jgi:hypothetical protein